MGISSLGVGSSILTQDVLDQLRKADEAKFITPIDLDLAAEKDKKDSFNILDANMTNLIDSINAVKDQTLFDGRSATVTGTSVEVTASANSDVQDFTINVDHLATKQIEQSGAFTASTDTVATGAGTLDISVGGGAAVTINYDATTTLDDLKKLINDNIGDQVDATVVQISATESRLLVSSVGTGSTQDISIVDNSGLLDTKLTDAGSFAAIQTGIDNQFTFNGQTITRSSNTVDDLVTGYSITLKEPGSSDVSVAQDREAIMTKIDSFIEKYNAAIKELNAQTKSSTDSTERGIFSSDSTVKSMKAALENMLQNAGGGVATIEDFGFDISKDGMLSIDKTVLNDQLDANATNVEAFFTGGDYTKADSSVVSVTGVFAEFSTTVGGYTDYNGTMDQLKSYITDNISSYEDRKASATERLDAKYEILKKQYAAYDAVIAKLNNASSMFVQMANAQSGSNN